MELQPILHVWINHDHDLVDLTITSQTHPPFKAGQHSEVVHTTQKHPFLTVEKGFLPVGQIKLGMHVLRADGSVGVITGWQVVPGSATMYNLEVAQDHTYTVGDGQWVVHNCGRNGKPDPANQVPGQPNLYQGQQYDPDALRSQGYKLPPENTKPGYQKSDQFSQFLKSQGKSIQDWRYRMETWTKRGAPDIENHYWTNMFDDSSPDYHHH